MFGTLLRKVFGSKNDRELKRIQPLIDQINQRESALTTLSLDELRKPCPSISTVSSVRAYTSSRSMIISPSAMPSG